MSLPLVFRSAAQAELDEAADWYESQRPGLGAEFVAEVQEVLDTIAAQPKRFPVASGDVREAAVSRFLITFITGLSQIGWLSLPCFIRQETLPFGTDGNDCGPLTCSPFKKTLLRHTSNDEA
jgi:plasmid stabilization system protein ParE